MVVLWVWEICSQAASPSFLVERTHRQSTSFLLNSTQPNSNSGHHLLQLNHIKNNPKLHRQPSSLHFPSFIKEHTYSDSNHHLLQHNHIKNNPGLLPDLVPYCACRCLVVRNPPHLPYCAHCPRLVIRNPPHLPYSACRCLVVRNPPHLPYCARCCRLVVRNPSHLPYFVRNPPHLPYCASCRRLVIRNPPHLYHTMQEIASPSPATVEGNPGDQNKEMTAELTHFISETDTKNIPLGKAESLKEEIAKIQATIEEYPQDDIKEQALSILKHLTEMSGQLFIGPDHNGKTPYLEARYKPLNLLTMLKEIRPFLLGTLEYAKQPQTKLEKLIKDQNSKVDSVIQEMQDMKTNTAKTEERLAKTEEKLAKTEQELQITKEKVENTEMMNAVYDFVHSIERILEDQSPKCLLTTIKNQRSTTWVWPCFKINSKGPGSLNQPDCLITIAQDHFSLRHPELDMLQNLLKWSLSLLPASATLDDLKKKA
ncbi:hypothetical protein PGT21_036953 [Puccinia graminis f. sp. tritici]|uniref:Uncharacterized protein n=1 Tax=Puccinia graminis f. sp. tritici TaxID=56615 RepID=A0A5B0QQR5_PUCGR|nr:hypothetical protein PGT21_036953 [Puccinia graminis f. sp. tritici]